MAHPRRALRDRHPSRDGRAGDRVQRGIDTDVNGPSGETPERVTMRTAYAYDPCAPSGRTSRYANAATKGAIVAVAPLGPRRRTIYPTMPDDCGQRSSTVMPSRKSRAEIVGARGSGAGTCTETWAERLPSDPLDAIAANAYAYLWPARTARSS